MFGIDRRVDPRWSLGAVIYFRAAPNILPPYQNNQASKVVKFEQCSTMLTVELHRLFEYFLFYLSYKKILKNNFIYFFL